MKYIVYGASLFSNGCLTQQSLLISDNKVCYKKDTMDNYSFMKLDAKGFLLTPGYLCFVQQEKEAGSFTALKKECKRLIAKGVTSFITVVEAKSQHELLPSIKLCRQQLLNSPIDYYLAVKIPLKVLTPGLIQICKKAGITMLILDYSTPEELQSIAWSWIRGVLHNQPLTLISAPKGQSGFSFFKKRDKFAELMKRYGFSHFSQPFSPGVPLTREDLGILGIYPHKGDIRVGGSVDYNLYLMDKLSYTVDENPVLDYDSYIPDCVIHKGKVLKAGNVYYIHPGFGEECKMALSGSFLPYPV
ncbi:hypothetical protein GJU40_02240 [Bacillus lacus]|uniref:Uncharacterized protein n=1 Tax=Metabacillus lacus TaxID=1983721 RepID=A0A7X2LYK6_9BACI|nr:hypothetical protein [Metabacillus lacus]MRX70987.1 hypothetical protein [Metabacillus lacus]